MTAESVRHRRRWVVVGGAVFVLSVVVAVIAIAASYPELWTRAMWAEKLADASDIRDYAGVEADAPYKEVVAKLGEPDYSGPGFKAAGHVDAAVFYWELDEGEIRGLVIDDQLQGRLKVGKW